MMYYFLNTIISNVLKDNNSTCNITIDDIKIINDNFNYSGKNSIDLKNNDYSKSTKVIKILLNKQYYYRK